MSMETNGNVGSDGITGLTPPQLSEIGLGTATRISKMEVEMEKATASGQPDGDGDDDGDDELFVKRPAFYGRSPMNFLSLPGQALTVAKAAKDGNVLASFVHLMSCLPAQRWMWCEFAYSFIDEPIAGSAFYDLDKLMKELGCRISTRTMPRRCWQLVRQPIGRPRRFSKAFIATDLEEWDHVRDLVRQMQKGIFDVKKHENDLSLLPSRVPMALAMDTKVTTYLPTGFAHGLVVSHEPKTNTYLVKLKMSVGGAAKEKVKQKDKQKDKQKQKGKEKGKEQEEQWLRLLDKKLQGDMVCESLPLPIMMVTTIEPVRQKGASKKDEKSATFSSAGFSKTLLESVVAIKNLMVIKQKTVDDFIQLNKEFETLRAQPTVRRDPKSTAERDEQQRCFAAHMIALHRVNGDILKPLRILHQFLDEYKEMEDLKAKTMTARERFQQCRLQSDLDLKAAEAKLGLVVKSDATRDLIRTLHTILYLCGALSSEKSADIRTIIDDIMASTMVNMPPDLSAVFKQMLSNVTPLCEAFGRVRKEPTLK
ncbi:uncharacterized protein LOC113566405, partial [Drosophila persimilis]|uniref:uncharacterized protein LOC113566405 n=1 Tax=Drosophila persimilis TaxID=7234 RepID=UPI000F07B4A9